MKGWLGPFPWFLPTLLPVKLELEEQKPRTPQTEGQRDRGGAGKMAPCIKVLTP